MLLIFSNKNSLTKGALGDVMVNKLESQTFTCDFESRWVPCSQVFRITINIAKKKKTKKNLENYHTVTVRLLQISPLLSFLC